MIRKRNARERTKRFMIRRPRLAFVVPIAALLLSCSLTVSYADSIGKIRLDPKAELSTGSTTGDGITVTISNLRSAEVGSDLVNLKWLGADDVYRVVHVELTNHSDATYYVNIVDFHMLATDAVSYASFAAFPNARGFPNGKGMLAPGESGAADLAFPMPRSKSPAAVVWGTPNLVGDGRVLAPTLGTRVILIPDADGRPVAVLKPRGPTGAVTQFGVTVTLEKAHVVDLPASVRYRIPDGYVVETIHGTLKNETNDTVEVHTNEFIPLDAVGLPSAYELKADPLAMDTRYVKSGQMLSGDLTYLVPENARPIAVRWNPAGFFGDAAPSDMIVTLPN